MEVDKINKNYFHNISKYLHPIYTDKQAQIVIQNPKLNSLKHKIKFQKNKSNNYKEKVKNVVSLCDFHNSIIHILFMIV